MISGDPTTSGPRLRRLHADLAAMIELAQVSDLVALTYRGNPPDRYEVTYRCQGLYRPAGTAEPQLAQHHVAEFYLHRDYPRRPPQIVWKTPIFHPNILSPERGGGVCIGSWTPSESLADLVVRVGEMVSYQEYNPADVLDPEAATWAAAHPERFPLDDRPLVAYGL